MRYNTDESGYIRNYALVGDVENSAEYAGALPDGFAAHAGAYRVTDGALVLDAERAALMDAGVGEDGGSGGDAGAADGGNAGGGNAGVADEQAAKLSALEAVSADHDEMLLDLQMQIIDMQLGLM